MGKIQKRAHFGCLFGIFSVVALTACGEQAPNTAYVQSGEVIAFGGGDAGVKNACTGCHGLKGEGDKTFSPRLAGLDPGYLHRQLDDYASGRRRHTVMANVAKHLAAEDRAKVSLYYADLPVAVDKFSVAQNTSHILYDQGDASRELAACASCHGKVGEGIGAGNPALANQPEKYIAEQLLSWKRGDRQNDPNHVMLLISQALTYAEIEQLSAYAAGLPGAHRPPALATFPQEHHAGPKSDASMPRQHEPG